MAVALAVAGPCMAVAGPWPAASLLLLPSYLTTSGTKPLTVAYVLRREGAACLRVRTCSAAPDLSGSRNAVVVLSAAAVTRGSPAEARAAACWVSRFGLLSTTLSMLRAVTLSVGKGSLRAVAASLPAAAVTTAALATVASGVKTSANSSSVGDVSAGAVLAAAGAPGSGSGGEGAAALEL